MAIKLKNKKKKILENWMNIQMEDPALRDDLISNEDIRVQSEELLDALLKVIDTSSVGDFESSKLDELSEISSEISRSRAKQGFSPRETGNFIFTLKQAVIDIIQEENSGNYEALYNDSNRINAIIDSLSITTFETYIQGREEVIMRQTSEIDELSTPVIRVWDGILTMPIIGTLDSARTQVVMENLLQEIVNSGSSIAILDISGVPAVDSLVAQHLIKTVSATRLMGAECIISGIRPEIAQTIVHLGIDLGSIVTKSSLQSALRFAFNQLNIEVSTNTAKHG